MRFIFWLYVVPAAILVSSWLIDLMRGELFTSVENGIFVVLALGISFVPVLNAVFLFQLITGNDSDHFVAVTAFCIFLGVGFEAYVAFARSAKERTLAADQMAARSDEEKRRSDQKLAEAVRGEQEKRQRLEGYLAVVNKNTAVIPERVNNAKIALDRADKEFEGGYLDPFWDEIERAITELAFVDRAAREVQAALQAYSEEPIKDWSDPVGAAKLSTAVTHLPSTTQLYERLRGTIRRTQTSDKYTLVFHVRRTNKILVHGFTTLGDAINDMGWRISVATNAVAGAVSGLQSSVSTFAEQVTDELRKSRSQSEEALRQQSERSQSQDSRAREAGDAFAEEWRAAEAAKIDLLDNIQRGVKPLIPKHKDFVG
ncbi:MAG: hypothetical protein SGJ19_08110 [Planctomycetia bacterium]|nr:hypothetical protein [Planctomycetia bacterium]